MTPHVLTPQVPPPDDARRVAARFGVTDLPPADLARLAARMADAAAAVAKLPALPKSVAPATVFGVPQPAAE